MRTPAERLAGQARITPALQHLASFRHLGPRVIPDQPLPITEDEIGEWIKRDPFRREGLAPHVARSLAYLDRFKRRDALTEALDLKGARA